MVDTVLSYHLLRAIPRDASLLLVGDVDQLPSVGPGSVLRDVLDSTAVPSVVLNDIFRQGERSQIVEQAHRINQGLMPRWPRELGASSDFYIISAEDPDRYNIVGRTTSWPVPSSVPIMRSLACDQRGCGTFGLTFAVKPYSSGMRAFQKDDGFWSTNSNLTMDLMLL